jgi:response regulator RpfG family c-di-GMP phosphodiesterase
MTTRDARSADTGLHRILVVDDEEIVLVALRDTLRREGYEVVTASDAMQGLEALRQAAFSVILTDHQMPLMTGLEFLAQAKRIQPDATRILITAVLSPTTVIGAINKGEIYRFIVKPWLREELLATVSNAVQRYEMICSQAILQAATLAMNEELKLLNKSLEEQIAREAAQNQQLVELNQALSRNLQPSVSFCLHVLETFYPALGTQARRVLAISQAMATALRLSQDQRQTLELSASLHDIGLVSIPRQLIRRWRRGEALSHDERILIERHPVLGQELVRFASPLADVGLVIRAHHERWDGTGYPDRLAGQNILWLGRLLAVAVSYAQSTHPEADKIQALQADCGRAFDPEAVEVLLRSPPQATAS